MTNWKKLESGLDVERTFPEKGHVLTIGESTEGKYIEKLEGIGENNSTIYVLENDATMRIGVWSSSVIDSKFRRIPIGSLVKVVYRGEKPSQKRRGKTYKDYDVFLGD